MKHSSAFAGFSPLASAALALVLGLAAPGAGAEKADRDKPMNVEADALKYDDLRQTSVFTGRVVLTKGTIVIRGAKVEVKQDPDGYQHGVVTAEPGKRAFYRQKREGVDEYIEGEGNTIEYDGRADKVRFIGRAEMRRLRGEAVNDEMTGSLITYDNTNDVFTVDGATSGAAPNNPGGRVRATLAPRPGASAPAAPPAAPARAASAPARAASGPATAASGAGASSAAAGTASAPAPVASSPRLRPSTTLSGEAR